jgi:hypothetical protein
VHARYWLLKRVQPADGVRSYIADYLARFRAPTGELLVPMPAIIGSGARCG